MDRAPQRSGDTRWPESPQGSARVTAQLRGPTICHGTGARHSGWPSSGWRHSPPQDRSPPAVGHPVPGPARLRFRHATQFSLENEVQPGRGTRARRSAPQSQVLRLSGVPCRVAIRRRLGWRQPGTWVSGESRSARAWSWALRRAATPPPSHAHAHLHTSHTRVLTAHTHGYTLTHVSTQSHTPVHTLTHPPTHHVHAHAHDPHPPLPSCPATLPLQSPPRRVTAGPPQVCREGGAAGQVLRRPWRSVRAAAHLLPGVQSRWGGAGWTGGRGGAVHPREGSRSQGHLQLAGPLPCQ